MSVWKKPKYIFLITVDALRTAHVECVVGGNLIPNIDKIAKNISAYSLHAMFD